MSIVCSDKTGTLTLNQMMVTSIRTRAQVFPVGGAGYDPYSGEVQGSEGALRKTNPDLLQVRDASEGARWAGTAQVQGARHAAAAAAPVRVTSSTNATRLHSRHHLPERACPCRSCTS